MTAKRVLIVDDQRDIRMLLRAGLEVLTPQVEIIDVPSGEEAMLVISRQKYDLLVSDVRLAGMSGLELIRKVRRKNPGLRVILITGVTDSEVRHEVKEAGADSFFFKPVDMAQFLAAVQQCLELEAPRPVDESRLPVRAMKPAPDVFAMLAEVRQSIAAAAVMLVDSSGRVLASAGNLPSPPRHAPSAAPGGVLGEADVQSAVKAIFESSRSISAKLNAAYWFFHSAEYDLHMAPLSDTLLLLTVCPLLPVGERARIMVSLLQAIEMLLAAQVDVIFSAFPALTAAAAPLPVGESEPETGAEADLSQLDAVFRKAGDRKASTGELDAFWDSLAGQTRQEDQPATGSISYEQARRLGLAPEEKEE